MHARQHRGFTLLEVVLTLTMLALLAAVAAPYLSNGVIAYNDSARALHTVGKLRVASERLAREIREIRRDGFGNYDIALPLSATSLTFNKLDGEQVSITRALPLVRMAYGSVAGTPTLIDQVNALTFSHWQQDGATQAGDNTDVAFIEFELVLDNAGNTYSQRTRVALRN